ncbi:MAG: DUF2299 family protein [Promethearchaeia archaeon]
MSSNESKIRNLIRNYLMDEDFAIKKIKKQKKLDFGFQFKFPPITDPSGRPVGKNIAVFKPKTKEAIYIELGTQISKPHVKALNSTDDAKMNFFMELRKFFFFKNMFFNIDMENNRYKISDQIFIDKHGEISKDRFFQTIRKVFNVAAYSNILLMEYCSGEPGEMTKDKKFSSGPGFSLYT